MSLLTGTKHCNHSHPYHSTSFKNHPDEAGITSTVKKFNICTNVPALQKTKELEDSRHPSQRSLLSIQVSFSAAVKTASLLQLAAFKWNSSFQLRFNTKRPLSFNVRVSQPPDCQAAQLWYVIRLISSSVCTHQGSGFFFSAYMKGECWAFQGESNTHHHCTADLWDKVSSQTNNLQTQKDKESQPNWGFRGKQHSPLAFISFLSRCVA